MPPSSVNDERKGHGLWIWVTLGGLVILLLAGISLVLFLRDLGEVDDSHMRPAWHSEAERINNPLAEFLTWLAAHPLKKDERLRLAGAKQPWNQTEAEALLAERAEHLKALDDLLLTDTATWLWPEGPAMASFSAPVGDINSVQYLGALLAIRSKATLDPPKALSFAAEAMRFGTGIAGAEGTSIHTLVGLVVCAQGIEALKKAALLPEVRKPDLDRAFAELKRHPVRSQDIAFAIRVEHETVRHGIGEVAAGRASGLPAADGLPVNWGVAKPNRALQFSIDLNESLLASLEQGWSGGLEKILSARMKRLSHVKSQPQRTFTIGIAGIVVTMASEVADIFVIHAADVEVQRIIAMTQIALRRHELEHGMLPDSLAEMSSQIQEEDMRDPWSAQPLIWSRDARLLYSVGRNGRDDGGDFNRDKPRDGADRGGSYWWPSPLSGGK